MGKLLESAELEPRARELGIDISGEPRTQSASGRSPRAPDHELQRRVIEAERRNRESRLLGACGHLRDCIRYQRTFGICRGTLEAMRMCFVPSPTVP
jgi:hypothetical protein